MVTILSIAGKNLPRETGFQVDRELENIIVGGRVSLDKKHEAALDSDLTVSGIKSFVRDRAVNYAPEGITTELGISGEIARLLRKAPDTGIIYASMSEEEVDGFVNVSRKRMQVKFADQFGRGGWTNLAIVRDLADKAGISVVVNVYEYWVRQFEAPDTQSFISSLQNLVGPFKPKYLFLNDTLFILDQKSLGKDWTGSAKVKSLVASCNQRENLMVLPKKLRLSGGQGPFDSSHYEGSMTLASRSGTVKIGNHEFTFHDYGTSEELRTTQSEETVEQSSETRLTTGVKTKTVTILVSGIDAFGNTAFPKRETVEKYAVSPSAKTTTVTFSGSASAASSPNATETLVEKEDTFHKYEYTHYRYQQPRLVAKYKAISRKVVPALILVRLGIANANQIVVKPEALFEESIVKYDSDTGDLLEETTRTTGHIIGISDITADVNAPTTWVAEADLPLQPVPVTLPYVGWPYNYDISSDTDGAGATVDDTDARTVRVYKSKATRNGAKAKFRVTMLSNQVVRSEHKKYQQMSKRLYQVKTVTRQLTADIPIPTNLNIYSITTETKSIAGDVPAYPARYRGMQIWVEKTIPDGEGPVAEISDGNIIDWAQATQMLEEVAWQFTTNRRFTQITLPGNLPVDVGMPVVNDGLKHSASGIAVDSFGERAFISAYSRTKDASDGSLTTSITIEGEI